MMCEMKLSKNEKHLLKEMFEVIEGYLEKDLLERYTNEFGYPLPLTEVAKLWNADMNSMKTLSKKLKIKFEYRFTKSCGEDYLNSLKNIFNKNG